MEAQPSNDPTHTSPSVTTGVSGPLPSNDGTSLENPADARQANSTLASLTSLASSSLPPPPSTSISLPSTSLPSSSQPTNSPLSKLPSPFSYNANGNNTNGGNTNSNNANSNNVNSNNVESHSSTILSNSQSQQYSLGYPTLNQQQMMQSMSMFGSLMTPTIASAVSVAPLGEPIQPDPSAWAAIEERFAPIPGETPEERRTRLKARKRERENQRRRERRAEGRRRRDEGRKAAEALGLTSPAQIKSFLEARERQYQTQQLAYATAVPVTHAHIMAASAYPVQYQHNPNTNLNAPLPGSFRPSTASDTTFTSNSSLAHSLSGPIPAIVAQSMKTDPSWTIDSLVTDDFLRLCQELLGSAAPQPQLLREQLVQFLALDSASRSSLVRGADREAADRFIASGRFSESRR